MNLHVFNPENDLALANFSPHFIPPRSARLMRDDLSVLPVWWAADGDVVWSGMSHCLEDYLNEVGCLIPDVKWCGKDEWLNVEVVCPWGWSPLLKQELLQTGCPDRLLPSETEMAEYRALSGRGCAVSLLSLLRSPENNLSEWRNRLCGRSFYCREESDIVSLVTSYPETILKAPWSGSGKGLRLGRGDYQSPLTGWCRRLLKEQGGVVVEPLYRRRFDFAFEFFADDESVRYTGLSVFFTTHRGTYGGNWVAPEAVKEAWLEHYIPHAMRIALVKELSGRLTDSLVGHYRGNLGVDMMLCDIGLSDGLAVHPCVEINLRRTMGQVAVDLSRWLASGSEARFVIDYEKSDGVLWTDHQKRKQERPLLVHDKLLQDGYIALTPVTPHTHYRARLEVCSKGSSVLFNEISDT